MAVNTVEEHMAHVRDHLASLFDRGSESIALRSAPGRVAAADVVSPVDLPLFRNSQMDGFAVDARSIVSVPTTLPIAATIAAGPVARSVLGSGTAVRIMTGAPVPAGADAIVPVEDTSCDDGSVTVHRTRQSGEYIREQGSDVRSGMTLVATRQLLAPRHVAVLAAVGLAEVRVVTRPRVAVITTGAELTSAGSVLTPGQIYDSNGVTLAANLEAHGADVVSVDRSSDDSEDFLAKLTAASENADLILTSGGVSMGDFEVVKDALSSRGARFGSVRMQPGGPQGTSMIGDVPILNFPGNPVSTVVSFIVFARSVIRDAAGLPPVANITAALASDVHSIAGKRQFLRGRLLPTGTVELVAGAGSHLVAAMAWADVLVDVPSDATALEAGDTVTVWPL